MALDSMQEIFDKMQEGQKPFWKVVQDTDVEERQVTPEASFEKMRMTWKAMLETVETYRGDLRSLSGLVGGDGQRMAEFAASGKALAGEYLSQVITLALCTAESNACMRKIVAAPTAGACGVLPAVLIPLYRQGMPEEEIVKGLYVAAGIGSVIAYRACIAGASGGCQAEIGSASAMAAGTLTAIRGGSAEQIGHATAMALKNLMGLICDPVAGSETSWVRSTRPAARIWRWRVLKAGFLWIRSLTVWAMWDTACRRSSGKLLWAASRSRRLDSRSSSRWKNGRDGGCLNAAT